MRPRWQLAVVVTVLFFLTQWGVARLLGVDFDTMADTTDNVWKGLTLRVGLTATVFTLIALWAGTAWNGGIYVQDEPPLPRWTWVVPILMVGFAVVKIATNDWGARGGEYMLALAIGVLFVGIAEETTFRGINLRALRGSTSNEFVVMVASAVLFGLVHGVNILNGAAVVPTLGQTALATLGGGAFYITMRLSGRLLVPILLHALWDYPILGRSGAADVVGLLTLIGQVVVYGLTIYIAYLVHRSTTSADETTPEPAA
ncbi:CPBP family intramembrane glutamic endopeptidase [Nocardioides bruguierae]|uniref:CPBP family intramembrane glutamic endopeptidase n=1 Tax=Nocardioides bruguierae TaxID=2945102 RepID=UPI00202221AB|nr:CPBP family intramembrane glutamic endopeptidase [Nocardioides bruguierae]MCL8024864.1 CPBP family intramembrane metalloprotease [Nocardioides bruguierae]